ncbi:MAG: hypothetical protein ACLS64_09690 [Eubacterium sp.]
MLFLFANSLKIKVLYRETVTLPSSDNLGYYYVLNGKSVAYKQGDEIKVTEDMQLLSIDNISVSIDKKASIRLNDPTGLIFSAKVTGDEAILDQSKGLVTEGVRYSDSRSVSYIAKQIKLDSNYYNSLSTTNKNIIDRFANN